MSLTIYEVLCNARYNLENAVFPFQIEMAKEQLANALDAIDNGKTLNDVWEEAQPNAAVPYKPTLTPPNGWVSVEERLPEPTYCVLVYTTDYSIEVDARGSDGEWMSYEVTHWMPLPVPPDRRPPEGEAK
jgi:hypothetical protein